MRRTKKLIEDDRSIVSISKNAILLIGLCMLLFVELEDASE